MTRGLAQTPCSASAKRFSAFPGQVLHLTWERFVQKELKQNNWEKIALSASDLFDEFYPINNI